MPDTQLALLRNLGRDYAGGTAPLIGWKPASYHTRGLDKPKITLDEAWRLASEPKGEPRPVLQHPHAGEGWRWCGDGYRLHLLSDDSPTCPYCTAEEHGPSIQWLIDGYMAKPAPISLVVSGLALIRMCEQAEPMARESANTLRLAVNGKMEWVAQAAELGDTGADLDCHKLGPDLALAVNNHYLAEAVIFLLAPPPEAPTRTLHEPTYYGVRGKSRKEPNRGDMIIVRLWSATSPLHLYADGRHAFIMPMHLGH